MSECAYGLDIGLTKDRTVLARVRRNARTGRCGIELLETWQGRAGQKVDLPEVEDVTAALVRRDPGPLILDPFQAVQMGQRLRGRGVDVREYGFTGESRRKLFATLLDLIRRDRLRCVRPHAELRRELLSLEVKETAAGPRVDHRVGRHDDHVVAVGLALTHLAVVPACPFAWCTEPDCAGVHMVTLDGAPGLRRTPTRPPEPDAWARAVAATWAAPVPDPELSVVVAVVVTTESDVAAVAVTRDLDADCEVLVRHVAGTRSVIEAAVGRWTTEFSLEALHVTGLAEPVSAAVHQMLATLRTAGLPVELIGTAAATRAWTRCRERLELGGVVLYALPTLREATTQRALALGVTAAATVLVPESAGS